MFKKSFVLTWILFCLLILSSCGLDYRYSLDESLHYNIDYVYKEDGPSYIIYQGKQYLYVGWGAFLDVGDTFASTFSSLSDEYKNDVMLSWNGYRYFGYIDEYISDTADNPVFIYEIRNHKVYFREDYNYMADIFILEETNDEIVFEDIFATEIPDKDFETINWKVIYLSSKQYPRIKIILQLGYVNNEWYICTNGWGNNSFTFWIPSDEFLEMLSHNEIIELTDNSN